jgi:hypothetical protein
MNLDNISYMDYSDQLIKGDFENMDNFINDLKTGKIDNDLLLAEFDSIETDETEDEKTKKAIMNLYKKNKGMHKKKKKKKDSSAVSVQRFDTLTGPQFMIKPFQRNLEGFLEGTAIVTNTGVFTYIDADGNKRKELRLPEEVFSRDTVESLKLKPVTNTHPSEIVTSDNIKKYQVGTTGSMPTVPATWSDGEPKNPEMAGRNFMDGSKLPLSDNYHQAIDMTITDEDAIAGIIDGNLGISCGYTVELDETPGTYMGMQYDAIQRNIRYNHVAVNIPAGRAGDAARIQLKIDSKDAYSIDMNTIKKNIKKEDEMDPKNLVTVKLDGLEYQASPEVAKKIDALQKANEDLNTDIEQLKKDNATLTGEKETLTSDNEQLKKDKEELEKSIPSKADALSAERSHMLSMGEKYGVDVKSDNGDYKSAKELTNIDIKKALILKAYPKSDAQIQEKANDDNYELYLDARLDGAIPILDEMVKNDALNNQDVSENVPSTGDQANEDELTVDEAKAKYVKDISDAYKIKEKK